MHFKILKMIATSGFVTALECTKFVFGRGSAPDPTGGAYSAPPDPLAGLRGGLLLRGRKGEGKEREGREEKGETIGEGKRGDGRGRERRDGERRRRDPPSEIPGSAPAYTRQTSTL